MPSYQNYTTAGLETGANRTINSPRSPTASDLIRPDGSNYIAGDLWFNNATGVFFTFTTFPTRNWVVGGGESATVTNPGVVELATLSELETGTAPTSPPNVPLANDVFTFVNATAISGGTPATTASQGFVFLSTNADAVSPYTTPLGANTVLVPGNITTMFASPGYRKHRLCSRYIYGTHISRYNEP